jgi:chromate transporter
MRLLLPEWSTLSVPAALLAAGALFATLRRRIGMLTVLAVCAAAGAAWTLLAG